MRKTLILTLLPIGIMFSSFFNAKSAEPLGLSNKLASAGIGVEDEDAERQNDLERLRIVPERSRDQSVSENRDWHLAEKTSWWGKPLDAKEFWTNRVIWLDKTAIELARRRGRAYPPIPPGFDSILKSLSSSTDQEMRREPYDVQGLSVRFVVSAREESFWDLFSKSMPHPPEAIEREQLEIAKLVFRHREPARRVVAAKTHPERVAEIKEHRIKALIELGYPREALTDDALFYVYVSKKRGEYEAELRRDPSSNNIFLQRILENSGLDSHYITGKLTQEELVKADAWKIAYLRRLLAEKVGSSYINAYSQAWNISLNQLNGK